MGERVGEGVTEDRVADVLLVFCKRERERERERERLQTQH